MTTSEDTTGEDTVKVEVEFTRRTPEERSAWRKSWKGRVWLTLHRIDCMYDGADHNLVSSYDDPRPGAGARMERTIARCRRATDRVYRIIRARGIEPCGMFYNTPGEGGR